MRNLRDVVERTGARVVLFGDGNDDPGLRTRAFRALASRGVFAHGWTDASGRAGRAAEIVRWLEREEARRRRDRVAEDSVTEVVTDVRGREEETPGDGGPNASARRDLRATSAGAISFAAADDAPLVAQPGGDALVGRFVMTAPGAGLTAAAAEAIVASLVHQSTAHDASGVFRGHGKTAERARGERGGFDGGFGRFAETQRPDSSDSSRSSSSATEAFALERHPAGFVSFRTSRSRMSLAATMTHRQSSSGIQDACGVDAADEDAAAAPRMSVEGTTATFSPPRLSRRVRDARDAKFALGEGARFITGGDLGEEAGSSWAGSSRAGADEATHVVRY